MNLNFRVLMVTMIFRVKYQLIVKLKKTKVYLEEKVFNHYSMDINLFETSLLYIKHLMEFVIIRVVVVNNFMD